MRFDLSDEEWAVIEPLLPKGGRGPRRVNDRRVLNGIFYILRTGAPWRDLPERYGPRTTVYNQPHAARVPLSGGERSSCNCTAGLLLAGAGNCSERQLPTQSGRDRGDSRFSPQSPQPGTSSLQPRKLQT